jgi:hypothetical protein
MFEQENISFRRLDWRFLLPLTEYEHIAYIGTKDKELLDSIEHVIGEVSVVEPDFLAKNSNINQERFDLIVVNTVDFREIFHVANLLKTNGVLYWQISRYSDFRLWWKMLKVDESDRSDYGLKRLFHPFHSITRYTNSLTCLGFYNIESYWHRPDFLSCKEIIPLTEPKVLNYVFSRGNYTGLKRVKFAIGQIAMRLGLLKFIAPNFSLVATKKF